MNRAELLRELRAGGHGPYRDGSSPADRSNVSVAPARPKHRPGISDAELKALMGGIAGVLRSSVVEPLAARISALEISNAELKASNAEQAARFSALEISDAELRASVAQLEERQMSYRGIWEASEHYSRGDCVTHSGALWRCQSSSVQTRPGSSPVWLLVVKRGRA